MVPVKVRELLSLQKLQASLLRPHQHHPQPQDNTKGDGPKDPPGLLLMNGSSWGTAQKLLKDVKVNMVALQEHRLGPLQLPAARAWLSRRGWNMVVTPGYTTAKNATGGGVAVLYRNYLDAGFPLAGGLSHDVACRQLRS